MIGPAEFLMMLASVSPALMLWIGVIIFAAIRLGNGGGRAERFLITGASLKIVGNLLAIPAAFVTVWLVSRGHAIDDATAMAAGIGILLNIVGMAGIICLVYAFWVRFKKMGNSRESVESS